MDVPGPVVGEDGLEVRGQLRDGVGALRSVRPARPPQVPDDRLEGAGQRVVLPAPEPRTVPQVADERDGRTAAVAFVVQ